MKKTQEFAEMILEKVRKGEINTKVGLEKQKMKIGKQLNLAKIPTNPDILSYASKGEIRKFSKIINVKPVRTISGVSVITVVVEPAPCPGECIYCPRGSNAPQSYTGLEPAVQRGIRNRYDPFLQVRDRLNQFRITGHPSEKTEIIILGGTFLSMKKDYQDLFVKRIFDALNGRESESIEQAQRINETAKNRCVGLTIETRPDFCYEDDLNRMLSFGGTRVEIGVQSVYSDVLKRIRRGHTIEDSIRATNLAKDSGFKCTYHMMPGLFVDQKKDLEQFKIIFENEDFRPDSLKIYPTMVLPNTPLYDLWKKGGYTALETDGAVELISKAMGYIPKYCRVIRVQRDIPTNKIVAGVEKSNLRELVERKCEEQNVRIQEIRYREIGHKIKKGMFPNPEKIKLCRMDYNASGGKEVFLSFEDIENDILFGFVRLRLPSKPFRDEIDAKTAIIRELHVFGPSIPLGETKSEAWQHKGFGRKLMEKAEEIARDEFSKKKVAVISGVGVREYYKKIDYKRDGAYMSKIL